MAKQRGIRLRGSDRKPVPGAKVTGVVDPKEHIEITIRLRRRARISDEDLMQMGAQKPRERAPALSREEFTKRFGANPADVARIEAFAHAHGLVVTDSNIGQGTVRLKGSVGSFNAVFGVKLQHYAKGRALKYRGRTGPIYVPKELHNVIVGVHGLDNRPVAKPHSRRLRPAKGQRWSGKGATARKRRTAPARTFTAPEIARLYNFPSGLTGKGQCVALIELNDTNKAGNPSGVGYRASDIRAYFEQLGIAEPTVVPVSVDGVANVPGPDPGGDDEVTLDIEVAGAVAPGATIAVYFAPNTTNGFIDALNTAIHDAERQPSVVSISWGGPEDLMGQVDDQFIQGLHQAMRDAAQLGVTVCCAAGDDGSADMGDGADGNPAWDGIPHADFPSSSPFALACGGTKLVASQGTVLSEVVWNEGRLHGAGGGGVSTAFPLPPYQQNACVPRSPKNTAGRGVPDLAGNADPMTGYRVVVGGKVNTIGGTSAVAPLVAGLIALINEDLANTPGTTAGFLNPQLYGAAASAFRDVTSGNNDIEGNLNGKYTAVAGWDACTGLGVPDGAQLLQNV